MRDAEHLCRKRMQTKGLVSNWIVGSEWSSGGKVFFLLEGAQYFVRALQELIYSLLCCDWLQEAAGAERGGERAGGAACRLSAAAPPRAPHGAQ